MKYKSFAKINLALDILGKDKSGYHTIRTVLTEIPLFDEIEIIPSDKPEVKFEGPESHLIDPKNNTVLNALQILKKNYLINVVKNIPLGAGLGGGSSNAATVIKALNGSENLAQIGMDVPFFIKGGTALGTHYGEKIEKIKDMDFKGLNMILVIPQLRKSTKLMYGKVDLKLCGKNKTKTKNLIDALIAGDTETVLENIHNDFENFAGSGFNKIKSVLKKNGADYVLLCGSGTAVIAFSNNPFDLKVLGRELENQHILNLTR